MTVGKEVGMNLDPATLSSTQLYQLASNGKIQLSQAEKDRVLPDYLFALAITNKLALSQHDKDRLRPVHLAHLAVMEKIDLSQDDRRRLPREVLCELFVQGFLGTSGQGAAAVRNPTWPASDKDMKSYALAWGHRIRFSRSAIRHKSPSPRLGL
jgi:hypothetical protein